MYRSSKRETENANNDKANNDHNDELQNDTNIGSSQAHLKPGRRTTKKLTNM